MYIQSVVKVNKNRHINKYNFSLTTLNVVNTIGRMNKKSFVIIRVTADEKNKLKKAAGGSTLTAFLLSSARKAVRYSRLIEDVERFERVQNKNQSCLIVKERL